MIRANIYRIWTNINNRLLKGKVIMKNKIIAGVFITLLAASAVTIWLPADKDSVAKENRSVAQMPSTNIENILSGKFSSGFESYIGDNVGFRGKFTELSDEVASLKGFTSNLGKVISVNKDVGTETTQKSRLLVTDDSAMEVFANNKEHMDWYLNVLNYYAENLDEGINFYNMLIPTQLEFKPPLYSNIQDKQKDTIDYIYKNKPERVIPVNVYDTISKHTDEYIYYRTDHHWTARGAYYGYTAFMDVMKKTIEASDEESSVSTEKSEKPTEAPTEKPDDTKKETAKPEKKSEDKSKKNSGKSMFAPVKLEDFPKHEESNFIGSLCKQAQSPELEKHPDTIEWYDVNEKNNIDISDEYYKDGKSVKYDSVIFAKDDDGNYKNDYSLFLGGDQPLIELTNKDNSGGRTLIIIKDSYCNAFAPWVIQNFHKVIMIDPRTYEGSFKEVLKRYKPDDVLIMNYIFTTTFSDYCQMTIDFFNRD